MNRDGLKAILMAADGVQVDGTGFRVEESHAATFYLGQLGQAMVIRSVVGGDLAEGALVLRTKEPEGELFVTYEEVHAFGFAQNKGRDGRRAGF